MFQVMLINISFTDKQEPFESAINIFGGLSAVFHFNKKCDVSFIKDSLRKES